jgi:hypothetical protein
MTTPAPRAAQPDDYKFAAIEEYQGATLKVSPDGMDGYEVDVVLDDSVHVWATLRGYETVEDALDAGRSACLIAPV